MQAIIGTATKSKMLSATVIEGKRKKRECQVDPSNDTEGEGAGDGDNKGDKPVNGGWSGRSFRTDMERKVAPSLTWRRR